MGKNKHCVFPKCNSDSRYAHKPHMEGVEFVPFPKSKQKPEYCIQWVNWLSQFKAGFTIQNVNYDTYLCSKHLSDEFFKTQAWLKRPNSPKPPVVTIFRTSVSITNTDNPLEVPKSTKLISILKPAEANGNHDLNKDSTVLVSLIKPANQHLDQPVEHTIEKPVLDALTPVKIYSTKSLETLPDQSLQMFDHDYGKRKFLASSSVNDHNCLDVLNSNTPKDGSSLYIVGANANELISHVETVVTLKKSLIEEIFSSYDFPKEWLVKFEDGLKMLMINYKTGGVIILIEISLEFKLSLTILNRPVSKHPLIPNLPSKIICHEDLTQFLKKLNTLKICSGTQEPVYRKLFDEKTVQNGAKCWITDTIRHTSCCLLSQMKRCGNCMKLRSSFRVEMFRRKKERRRMSSFKNLSNTELIVELKKRKSDGITLKKKLSRREKKISKLIMKTGEATGANTENWLVDVLRKNVDVKSDNELCKLDFPKQFLATQFKMSQLKSKKCRRWHPLVVHWCLFMYHQAPNLYKSLESSGILHLPSYRTLLRHTPDVGRKPNFQPAMFIQLAQDLKLSSLEDPQKYFSLLLDEMKVKEDLIYCKKTGDIVGYTKIKDPYDKIAAIDPELFDKKEKPIATHALVLMIRGATTRLKAPIAHFPTDTISGDELHFLVWRAIALLELKGFKIIAVIGDGASTNRKVFTKHHGDKDGCYKCKNVHASDEDRFIYFVFDPPHLMKTVRNCLLNSREGCKFRLMFKNGQYMVWDTIIDLFERERHRASLKKAFRLTDDHVYPQAQQKMKVKLATQVLSESVANAIYEEFGEEKSETIKFLRTFNRWFDCMNSRNFQEGYHTRNPWVNPYKSLNDQRLKWLRKDFLQYLCDWEEDVKNRCKVDGKPYNAEERKRMLLSQETLSGLKQTTMAMVEIIEFLLSKGAMFVLTGNFNQDPVENEFSRQRQANGSGQHPTYNQVCNNHPKLRAIKLGKMKISVKGKNCTKNNNDS